MRILAISGSLRAASHNTALLRAAADLAPAGVEVELYDGLESLPPYNEDRDTELPPAEVAALRAAIAAADAVLLATPEFNGTMPGQIKHAVDWASRPYGDASALWGKPVAVIGASVTDYGAIWAQDHLRKALGHRRRARARRGASGRQGSGALRRRTGSSSTWSLRDRLAEIVERWSTTADSFHVAA